MSNCTLKINFKVQRANVPLYWIALVVPRFDRRSDWVFGSEKLVCYRHCHE